MSILAPFVNLLCNTLLLYMYCVIVWAILASLISFKIVNAGQPVVRRIMDILDQLIEPVLKPIRRKLPRLNGIDLSPIVLILLIEFTRELLYAVLFHL